MKLAILDDYQNAALGSADWRSLGPDIESTVFESPGLLREVESWSDEDPRVSKLSRFMLDKPSLVDQMRQVVAHVPPRVRIIAKLYRWADRTDFLRGTAWRACGYHHLVRIFFHFSYTLYS